MKSLCRTSAGVCNHALANWASTKRTVAQCKPIVRPSKAGRRALVRASRVGAQEESRQTPDDPLTTPMTTRASIAATSAFRGPYAQTALVFDGGGALGAYQAESIKR